MRHDLFLAMPSPVQIYAGVNRDLPCPITVQDGRQWLNALPINARAHEAPAAQCCQEPAPRPNTKRPPDIQLQEIWFKYDRDLPDAVKDLSLEVAAGQFYGIVGGNGTKPPPFPYRRYPEAYRGRVRILGQDILKRRSMREQVLNRIAMLPQNPGQLLFVKNSGADLYEILAGTRLSQEEKRQKVQDVCAD